MKEKLTPEKLRELLAYDSLTGVFCWRKSRRGVETALNVQNIKVATSRNLSGLLGASYHARDGLWRSRIMVNKKPRCIGYFKTELLAHEAYIAAKRELHPGCTI